MIGRERTAAPKWHKRLAIGYLLGSCLGLILFVIMLVPALPLFIKLFVPFPKLEDASHWTGRVQVQGEFQIGLRGNTIPRFFIVTPEGVSHEFKCGYLGRRIPCGSNYTLLDGATGEVWYHPIFGELQYSLVVEQGPLKGKVLEMPIEVVEAVHKERFFYERYIGKLFIALVPLAVVIWQLTRYRRYRAMTAAGDNIISNNDTNTSET
jgi:hypothetical protein